MIVQPHIRTLLVNVGSQSRDQGACRPTAFAFPVQRTRRCWSVCTFSGGSVLPTEVLRRTDPRSATHAASPASLVRYECYTRLFLASLASRRWGSPVEKSTSRVPPCPLADLLPWVS